METLFQKFTKNQLYLIVGGIALLAIVIVMALLKRKKTAAAVVATSLPFAPILKPLAVRVDKGGDGHFSTSRIGHTHEGTDFACSENQTVYAPFSGKIVRKAYPYANDLKWNGLLLEDETTGYACKLFYCTLSVAVGSMVTRGQAIAKAQAISIKYSSGVTNHVHCEIRRSGSLLNPETVFFV